MLCAHAMFKAALFMVVGIIDHATGTRDIRRLAWLGHRMPALFVIAAGATASMAALPPFLGFVAKEADFETLLYSPRWGRGRRGCWPGWWRRRCSPRSTACVSCGAPSRARVYAARAPASRSCTARRSASVRPAVLAAAGLFFGIVPGLLERLLDPYAESLPGGAHYHLALWHGFNLPLVLSAAVLLIGAASFVARARLPRAGGRWLPLGNADRIYDATLRGLEFVSIKVTGVTQRGSLPATQSVILLTLVALPVTMLALGARDRPELRLWEGPLQPVIALLMVGGALAPP
jgi:multicomponent Na+:H+ antiporter subunit A